VIDMRDDREIADVLEVGHEGLSEAGWNIRRIPPGCNGNRRREQSRYRPCRTEYNRPVCCLLS
jgi:hypothetical protein